MVDVVDIAAELEQIQRDDALAKALSSGYSGKARSHCLLCGTKIPAARLKHVAGCQHCVKCKTNLERKG